MYFLPVNSYCLSNVCNCWLFSRIEGLHFFCNVANDSVCERIILGFYLYFLCRPNTSVSVDCQDKGSAAPAHLRRHYFQTNATYQLVGVHELTPCSSCLKPTHSHTGAAGLRTVSFVPSFILAFVSSLLLRTITSALSVCPRERPRLHPEDRMYDRCSLRYKSAIEPKHPGVKKDRRSEPSSPSASLVVKEEENKHAGCCRWHFSPDE